MTNINQAIELLTKKAEDAERQAQGAVQRRDKMWQWLKEVKSGKPSDACLSALKSWGVDLASPAEK